VARLCGYYPDAGKGGGGAPTVHGFR
jgi:hypothetical protein